MKNTTAALKYLAEKRGRIAHELAVAKRVAEDVNRRAKKLEADLVATDRVLVNFDSKIDPTKIEPVAAHTRYGARGALKAAVVGVLKLHEPEWVATDTVEALVCLELGLTFETPAERKRWYDNSFRKQLKRLVEEGEAERQAAPASGAAEVGYWRLLADGRH